MYLTYDFFVASWGDDLCCCWRYRMHLEESRTLHAFEWLMSCVIIEYVTWWTCALLKFFECCDYVDWCICTLVDFVDGCEWLNYALIVCVTCLCIYTWWINLMLIILVIIMKWELYMCVCVCVCVCVSIYIYIYIWFGDSFDNDECLIITLKWWIVLVELSMLNDE